MAGVLIVSNRLPLTVKKINGKLRFERSVGGLATALSSYVNQRRNHWIGWPGIASEDLTDADRLEITRQLAKRNCTPVFLTKKQIDDYYNGYSNSLLWPLFHELPFTVGEAQERWWRCYRQVNRLFAEAAANLAWGASRVWVHDYQLMLVPEMLRAERADVSIGFFLHIPFPPSAVFSGLKEGSVLLKGLLGADLVGFHTQTYTDNFLDTCRQFGLNTDGVRVGEFPIGIDYKKYSAAGRSPAVRAAMREYQQRYRGRKVIVAVDRLEPSKGLVERLRAYRQLLASNSRLTGRVVFSLVAAPSRTEIEVYRKLAAQLQRLVNEINATFGTANWQPVDYMPVSQPFENVAALFQIADVAFIAPLRDGMNLAAKEYVASRRRGGVLILSETAGAAEELKDALLVNPFRLSTSVTALQRALIMPPSELSQRLNRMQRHLANHTVNHWSSSFISAMRQPVPGATRRTRSLTAKLQPKLVEAYNDAERRLLLIDYDGSLVPFKNDFQAAKPSRSTHRLLAKLSRDQRNEVVVISGRGAKDLEDWLGDLPISLVAEHGAAVRRRGRVNWRTYESVRSRWKRDILPVLEKYADITPGTQVEVKEHSLVWHYRSTPAYNAQKAIAAIKRLLKPMLRNHGLKLYQGHKILEIKNPEVNKGQAAKPWLKQDYDFVIAIGDDYTDESLFSTVPEQAYSIKVGRGRTAARYRLKSPAEVTALLKKLA